MQLKEVHIRWMGIPLLAFIAEITAGNQMPTDDPYWYKYFVAVVFTAVYWNGACFLIFSLRKKYGDIKFTKRRLVLSALGIIFWMSLGGIPLKLLFAQCTWQDVLVISNHAQFLPFNFMAAIVISTVYEAAYFFEKWKEAFKLNEQLRNQQIRTQYEVLQNQMSPHFLFNSLNTLTTIIAEDPKSAIVFTEQLSEVYRYILQNKERELVTLTEELDFVKSYLYLLKIRYPDNLQVEVRVNDHGYLCIPPLTLQMLVENAIKHNVVSKSKPLHVEIYVEKEKWVVVKNNLQKKDILEKSTQTGLDNIRKRYEYLKVKNMDVRISENDFIVAVPLIEITESKAS